MVALLALSRGIDRMNEAIGRSVAWLILVAVVVSAANAIARKALNMSSNAWLELQWYLFSAAFLGCAAWTLLRNEHIRIDVVAGKLGRTYRNWMDVVGHIVFLMPLCFVMLLYGVPFFWRSFVSGEVSTNAGGLILWPAKILVPLGFGLLFLQAFSELIKRIAIIRGDIPDPADGAASPH